MDRENFQGLIQQAQPSLEELIVELFHVYKQQAAPFKLEWAKFYNNMSGVVLTYNGVLEGFIFFAQLADDRFLIKKCFYDQGNLLWTRFDYYFANGELQESKQESLEPLKLLTYYDFDSSSVLSHLYSILHFNYSLIDTATANLDIIGTVEKIIRELQRLNLIALVECRHDPLVLAEVEQTLAFEHSSPLKWKERQQHIKSFKQQRDQLLKTKYRANRKTTFWLMLKLFFFDLFWYFKRSLIHPGSSFRGILYKYTIGVILWFIDNVKSNLGYSIALAIYGPFTFYFITQPMNPHAMWAVGKVRSAYLNVVNELDQVTGKAKSKPQQNPGHQMQQVISKTALVPLSIYSKKLNEKSFSQRMDDFKQLQIGLEKNMVFAARMGRIEQMETQFSFPLIVESVWRLSNRYLQELSKQPKSKFVLQEIADTQNFQHYLWDKFYRFINDYLYIILDVDNEQVKRGYFLGRMFIQLDKMRLDIEQYDKHFAPPVKFKQIFQASKKFKKLKSKLNTPVQLLQASEIFQQKDPFDTDQLRSYMTRQWEILFLQQNKVQESANFGLQTYTWSIRNFIWAHQTFYELKLEELPLRIQGHKNAEFDELYASLYHLMQLEFVSIKKELVSALPDDLEVMQRTLLLKNINNFLVLRK